MLLRKKIEIDGCAISYLETDNQSERIIFFFHGNSNSAELWQFQLNNLLWKDYKMIAFDLPGHGKSDSPPSNEDFNVLWMGKVFAQCVNQLAENRPYILCGLSLGGNIISEMFPFGINPQGIILISSNLVGEHVTPYDIISHPLVHEVLFTANPKLEDIKKYFEMTLASSNPTLQENLLLDYLVTNSEFRPSFTQSIIDGHYSDEVALIKEFKSPVLHIYGKKDKVGIIRLMQEPKFKLWKNKIFVIEDASHIVVWDQPEQINALITLFVEDIASDNILQP